MLSKVWPGVCNTVIEISPILKTWLSSAIIQSNEGLAFGPNIIGEFVFLDKVKCPLIKSAWKCVSKIYLILEFEDSAKFKYSETSLNGSITAASPLLSI